MILRRVSGINLGRGGLNNAGRDNAALLLPDFYLFGYSQTNFGFRLTV